MPCACGTDPSHRVHVAGDSNCEGSGTLTVFLFIAFFLRPLQQAARQATSDPLKEGREGCACRHRMIAACHSNVSGQAGVVTGLSSVNLAVCVCVCVERMHVPGCCVTGAGCKLCTEALRLVAARWRGYSSSARLAACGVCWLVQRRLRHIEFQEQTTAKVEQTDPQTNPVGSGPFEHWQQLVPTATSNSISVSQGCNFSQYT